MATHELRPMSIGEILDGAFAIYRASFATLVSIAIVCQGVPTIMNTYVTLSGGPLLRPLLWLIGLGLGAFGGLLAAGATVFVISEAYLGRDIGLNEALQAAWGKVLPLFLAGMVKYLLMVLAGFAFVIPAFVVACGYAVVTQVIVLEPLDAATDALGRSWRLTKGFKGKAFRLGFIVFAIIYLPFIAVGGLTAFLPAGEETFEIGAQLLALMIYPLVACAFTLLYYDLRVRQEAFDLQHLSAQLGLGGDTGA